MKGGVSLIFLCLISLCALGHVHAQDDAKPNVNATAENKTEELIIIEEPVIGPSPDVSTYFVFPSSSVKSFTVGSGIPVVVGFQNHGNTLFNVTTIFASLMYPQDWRYYIQNYTKEYYGEVVASSELRSFLYTFYPDPMLDPRDFGLTVKVFYTDPEGGNFTSVVYNNSITLTEAGGSFDAQTLFTYVGIVGVAGLVGFGIYKVARGFSKKRPRKVEYGTQSTVVDNEWLEGTAAMRSSKSPKSPRTKPKKS